MTEVVVERRGTFPSSWRLLGGEIGTQQRLLLRQPSRFASAAVFPLMFLVLFGSVFSDRDVPEVPGVSYATWLVPGIVAFGILSATIPTLATGMAILRDTGVLKRLRGTPLPGWVFIGGAVGSSVVTGVAGAIVTVAVGVLAYDVELRAAAIPGAVLVLVLGTACLSALGLAIARLIPSAEAAPAVSVSIVLPLSMASGVFMPDSTFPDWLRNTMSVLPLRPFVEGLRPAFGYGGSWPAAEDVAVLLVWAVAAVLVAAGGFSHKSSRA